MKLPLVGVLVCSVFLTPPQSVFAWGVDGHRITAEIAERNLNPKVLAAIREITGAETLAEIANWPDFIRSDRTWDFAKPWHYISIDDDETWEDFERVPEDEGDLLLILEKLEAFLRDPDSEHLELSGAMGGKTSKLKISQRKEVGKWEALAFYVHFLADLHQPLHVGRREDQGGNRIQVEWFDEEMTLHKVWDEKIIESTHLSYTEFSTHLNRISEETREEWAADSYMEWANESKEARDLVYDFGSQRKSYFLNIMEAPALSYDYRTQTLPFVREQLAKGGIRLAAKLNDIFGSK